MPTHSDSPQLIIPAAAAGAFRMAHRLAQLDRWAQRIASHAQPLVAVDFGARVFGRFAAPSTSGVWAAQFAARFEPAPPPAAVELPVSPYVPPQRQISAARQGAAEWQRSAPAPASAPGAGAPPSFTAEALLRELESQGWGAKP